MQKTYTAIVIRVEDYRDSDKRLILLTPNAGLVSGIMRGVKKQTAKLRYAAQPFVLCEYTILDKGGIIIGCELIEDINWMTEDYDKYIVGCVMLEAAAVVATVGDASVFTALLSGIKNLLNEEPHTVLSGYLAQLIMLGGLGERTFSSARHAVRGFENAFEAKLQSAILLP